MLSVAAATKISALNGFSFEAWEKMTSHFVNWVLPLRYPGCILLPLGGEVLNSTGCISLNATSTILPASWKPKNINYSTRPSIRHSLSSDYHFANNSASLFLLSTNTNRSPASAVRSIKSIFHIVSWRRNCSSARGRGEGSFTTILFTARTREK